MRHAIRLVRAATAVWLLLAVAGFSCAAEARVRFHLDGGDATAVLRAFSTQSGVQILYPVAAVRGVRLPAVAGVFTPRAALERLVQGTGLTVVQDAATGALALARPPAATPARGSAPRVRTVAPAVASAAALAATEELVRLSPFEVRSDPANSYQSLDTNTLTSFRIARDRLPAASLVFNRTFMDDVGATSVQAMLVSYAGTVGTDPNNTAAALAMPGDRDGAGGLGIRGLSASAPKRDGFIGMNPLFRSSTGYNDTYSIERVEVISGPQSLLYGAVGGGGVVNLVSKRADFEAVRGQVQARLDGYGGRRGVADMNAGTGRFAVRVAAVGEQKRGDRYNIGDTYDGVYVQAAVKLGPATTLRLFGERDTDWATVPFTPSATDLGAFLPTADPRRGQDVRYLVLTGQLQDLQGGLWNGPVDYQHLDSLAGWWSSEQIDAKYTGLTFESDLGAGFSTQATAIYSETMDDRFTVAKNLVPGAGRPGAGANPFAGTAVRITPGDNWQSDRTKGVRVTLLHEGTLRVGPLTAASHTILGLQGSHQGPAFGSSGIDRLYYQADPAWNPIVNPAVALDYGRVPLGSLYFPVQDGIPLRALFRPGTRRLTLNGQNYVLEPRIRQDPAAVSATNPAGLVPNNPTAANANGFSGAWNRGGETHDHQWFAANFSEWADGRVTTLLGASLDRFETLNANPGAAPTHVAPHDYPGYQIGLTYRVDVVPGLRLYALRGTAGQAAGTTRNLVGGELHVPHTVSGWPEVGAKYEAPNGRWSVQLAVDPRTEVTDENLRVGTAVLNAVNPRGINGRFNNGDQWVNVDRASSAVELSVVATPRPNWRFRLNATRLDGGITNAVVYPQLYNDQFYTRGATVTYGDGTPVLVDPQGANGPAVAPLTLAMLNDPANPFYAAPDPDSGRITNGLLIAALTTNTAGHGLAATGATGLPLSAVQYAFANPHQGQLTVVSAGERTTGINEYTLNAQTHYAFTGRRLRGVAVLGDLRTYWRNRAYYTTYGAGSDARRVLYRLPSTTVIDVGVSYRRALPGPWRRLTWTTRLNVENLLDASRVWVMPNPANGANLNARLSAAPRQWVWSNTVEF